MRRIDCHIHLVGDGSSGSGCWIQLKSFLHRLQAKMMLRGAGIPASVLGTNMDEAYPAALKRMVKEAPSLDAGFLLAQDLPYDDNGKPLPEKGTFYVPNEFMFEVVESAPDLFIPTISIHPGRPDAMDELEKCIARGAKVLKLLPNCLNVDCSAPRYKKFWERIADAGIIFLSHTGGEMTLPVLRSEYADPAILKLPLECGVKVIAAHCAGRSGFSDPDYTDGLLEMFEQYPGLYGDNSAFSSYNRARTGRTVLNSGLTERIVHGSDFPVPIISSGPRMLGMISRSDYKTAKAEKNQLERDCLIKKAMGFDDTTFTRVGAILDC